MSIDSARSILASWLQRKGLLKNPSSLVVTKAHYSSDFCIYRGKNLLGKCNYDSQKGMFCDLKLFGLKNKPSSYDKGKKRQKAIDHKAIRPKLIKIGNIAVKPIATKGRNHMVLGDFLKN